jgi:DNA-binding NarL/FixJ family response regulator
MDSANWALLTMIPLAAVAVVQLVSVYLFLSLKRELRGLERRIDLRPQAPADSPARELQAQVAELERRLGAATVAVEAPAPQSPIQGMNLTRRAQVLRMSRRGERPEQIAATLGIPLNEVELLLKVHHATAS